MTEGAPPQERHQALWTRGKPIAARLAALRARFSDQDIFRAALFIGAGFGLASLIVYDASGYSRWMLFLWLLGVCTLAYLFRVRSGALPRIALVDLAWAGGLMLLFAPLYVVRLYEWPVQVSSDEPTIMGVSLDYATRTHVDPFSVSDYWIRPSLLFMAWGRLGKLIGGVDLYHMRLLHALVGLVIVAASYALFRLMLPRGWAAFAAALVGFSHALLMISRLAMRENTSLLVEVVALTLLIWGLRNDHAFITYVGGFVAGLGFYVYHPGRATFFLWLIFLVTLALLYRERYPLRMLGRLGAIAAAGFVLMAGPVSISESKIPHALGEAAPRSQLLIFREGRERQMRWVYATSIAGGIKKNISFGLTTFNSKVVDHGWIYANYGHGFVDPLTGILIWVGAATIAIRYFRRRRPREPEPLLMLVGFLTLWLAFAFLVNEAPNYTRLLITLPFVAFLVTAAVRALGSWLEAAVAFASPTRARRATIAVAAGALIAIGAGNIAIAWDYVDRGRTNGDPVGNTGRYVAAHRSEHVYLVADQDGSYRYLDWGSPDWWQLWTSRFKGTSGIETVYPSGALQSIHPQGSFALLMSRSLFLHSETVLRNAYPQSRLRNITPDGRLVVVEVPKA